MQDIIKGRRVTVGKDGDINKALRKFKKRVNNSGIIQEVRERKEYVKPSEKRKLAKARARSRWLRKQRQSDIFPKNT